MKKIAGIDIGNSRIKISYRENLTAIDIQSNYIEKIKEFFEQIGEYPKYVGSSSVNSNIFDKVYDLLSKKSKVFIQDQLLNNQKFIDFNDINGIGTDRIFGMIGALSFVKPPFITVDCGTAITINFVDNNYVCKGGVIFAGSQTQSKALVRFTDQLFETNLLANNQILAKNTEMALNNGIIYSSAFSIIAITNEIIKQNNLSNVNIVITGGSYDNLKFVLEKNNFKYKYIQNLILDGIISCVDNLINLANDK